MLPLVLSTKTMRRCAVAFEAVIFDVGGVLEITPPTGWGEVWAGRHRLRRDCRSSI
jgi:hypothetical protein